MSHWPFLNFPKHPTPLYPCPSSVLRVFSSPCSVTWTPVKMFCILWALTALLLPVVILQVFCDLLSNDSPTSLTDCRFGSSGAVSPCPPLFPQHPCQPLLGTPTCGQCVNHIYGGPLLVSPTPCVVMPHSFPNACPSVTRLSSLGRGNRVQGIFLPQWQHTVKA